MGQGPEGGPLSRAFARRGRPIRRGAIRLGIDGRPPFAAPAIVVRLLLAFILAAAGCDQVGTASPAATLPSGATPGATDPDATPTGFVPASDPVPLEVVESGFTVLPDDASGTVTYVAILRNPNTEWAFVRANVLLDLLDDAGDFLAGADVTVTLLPGQTSAIAGQISGGAATASLDVRPPDDLTAFLPRPATEETFEAIDVSTRSTGSGWLTTGTLVSRFETTQTFVEVVVVHRDASGAVRGGATGGVEVIEPGQEVTFDVLDAAPFQDIGATEVYWRVTR